MSEFFQQLSHFAALVLATTIALLLIALVLIAVRRFWPGPIEPVGLLDLLIATNGTSSERIPVNVDYRDSAGAIMNLAPLVRANLRNGRGASFDLSEGCFQGCDPKFIKAGASCTVSLADGHVTEPLWVQVDPERQTLFVRSRYTIAELYGRINNRPSGV